jgi:hypothetical protein
MRSLAGNPASTSIWGNFVGASHDKYPSAAKGVLSTTRIQALLAPLKPLNGRFLARRPHARPQETFKSLRRVKKPTASGVINPVKAHGWIYGSGFRNFEEELGKVVMPIEASTAERGGLLPQVQTGHQTGMSHLFGVALYRRN